MSRILMLVQTGVLDDARVRKEVDALVSDGHSVIVIGASPPGGAASPIRADVRFVFPPPDARPSGTRSVGYSAIRWLLLPEHRARRQHRYRRRAIEIARSEEFDIVHCHDYPTLSAGFAIAEGRPVIYDSHECWSGRLRRGRPEPLRRWLQHLDEGRLARRCAAVIAVSDELGSWIEERHRIEHVEIVRNSFPTLHADSDDPRRPTGIVYAGRVGPGRDLSAAFEALLPQGVELILAGPVEPGFDVPETVRYEGVLPVDEIPSLLVAQGLALVSLENSCLNHRLALPNKVFQAVASGVPVVAADLPALRRLVSKHKLGTLYEPGNAGSLSTAIADAVARHDSFTANVVAAQADLSWEADASRLRSIYCGLM